MPSRRPSRRSAGPDGRSGLAAIAARAASFANETAAVRRAIDAAGDVSDSASPALRDIRDSLRRQRAKLRSTLDTLTRGRDTAKYLQDQIVTDRNGRYVVVVRAEHRDAIPGIVHGSSTSGASLYLEPLATVALNNDVVALVEREQAEDPPDPARADRRVSRARRRARRARSTPRPSSTSCTRRPTRARVRRAARRRSLATAGSSSAARGIRC